MSCSPIKVGGVKNLAHEAVHARDGGHLRIAASTDRRNKAIEASIGGIVDDPSALFVLVRLLNSEAKLGPLLEPVSLPESANLGNNLMLVWVTLLPLNRRMKPVH